MPEPTPQLPNPYYITMHEEDSQVGRGVDAPLSEMSLRTGKVIRGSLRALSESAVVQCHAIATCEVIHG